MVSLGISEFTFDYAFLYEQTSRNWIDLKLYQSSPVFSRKYAMHGMQNCHLTGKNLAPVVSETAPRERDSAGARRRWSSI